jgi:hypothetical protein
MLQESKKILGYTLHEKRTHWELQTPNLVVHGSLTKIKKLAVETLGFSSDEFDLGVLTMNEHFHNSAEFGFQKRFIYSFDQEEHDISVRN